MKIILDTTIRVQYIYTILQTGDNKMDDVLKDGMLKNLDLKFMKVRLQIRTIAQLPEYNNKTIEILNYCANLHVLETKLSEVLK